MPGRGPGRGPERPPPPPPPEERSGAAPRSAAAAALGPAQSPRRRAASPLCRCRHRRHPAPPALPSAPGSGSGGSQSPPRAKPAFKTRRPIAAHAARAAANPAAGALALRRAGDWVVSRPRRPLGRPGRLLLLHWLRRGGAHFDKDRPLPPSGSPRVRGRRPVAAHESRGRSLLPHAASPLQRLAAGGRAASLRLSPSIGRAAPFSVYWAAHVPLKPESMTGSRTPSGRGLPPPPPLPPFHWQTGVSVKRDLIGAKGGAAAVVSRLKGTRPSAGYPPPPPIPHPRADMAAARGHQRTVRPGGRL